MRVRGLLAFSFGPSHPTPAFHTRVARKKLSFCQKRGFAPGIMDSCPRASAVRILKGVLLLARPWCDFHLLFHSAPVVSFIYRLLRFRFIFRTPSAVASMKHLSQLTWTCVSEGPKKERFARTPPIGKYQQSVS